MSGFGPGRQLRSTTPVLIHTLILWRIVTSFARKVQHQLVQGDCNQNHNKRSRNYTELPNLDREGFTAKFNTCVLHDLQKTNVYGYV
jgi:hypothetical protein